MSINFYIEYKNIFTKTKIYVQSLGNCGRKVYVGRRQTTLYLIWYLPSVIYKCEPSI